MSNSTAKSPMRHLSMLGAWALAFGCAVGSDAFVMPWSDFLPKAGPLGTVLGVFIGGLVMAVVAWNFHYMINRWPGPGGAYAYASKAFGHDHGFLCGFLLGFAYLAIVWLDVTALVVVAHYTLGDAFRFGFHYTIQNSDIYFGDILLSFFAIAVASAICCRCRLSGIVQTVLAVILAAGIFVCFAAAALNHEGGLETIRPFFAPDRGNGLFQILNILAIAPWLFVGFEAISNSSAEFRFPARKAFGVMLATLATAVVAYAFLTAIPVFTLGDASSSGWTGAVASLASSGGEPDFHAFDVASRYFGKAGMFLIGLTLIGAIFTNLVGNTVAVSRLAAAMADDGALPSFLGGRNADGAPRNAVLAIAALAALVVPLGRAVIGVVVDISILGAAVAYAYTSAAAFKTARRHGDRGTQATGILGLVISIVVVFLFVMPFVSLDTTVIATESYLVLIVWCLAALATFIAVFSRDRMHRFGQSPVAWISLFVIIMILSVVWIRQTTRETTEKALADIINRHAESHGHDDDDWRVLLRKNLSRANRSIFRNNLVQGGLNFLALALMFGFYVILRRREREMELEKAKAKSYFFSTVSHDIRTPLNAIIGYSTMLASGFKTEAERQEAIDSILVSGKTLLGLVNDVLDLSKLESGKMEIHPEPTDCSRLMHAVMEAFRVSSGKSGLELRCRAGDMPLLMLDPQRLRQIAFNLVGNAVKFTKKGYVELRVGFDRRGDEDSGTFRMDVEDTGCGISEEDQKRIGSAYVQVGAKVSRNGGTGLGLAICRQLAAAMGGSLEMESTLGEGSTFSVVIPEVKVAAAPDAQARVPTAGGDAVPASGGCDPLAPHAKMPHRLLLVDDSKMNLMVLKALLTNMGDFEIVMASDGQEALKALEAPDAQPFDLVLTDMWMPNLDGEGLVRAVRANPALSSLRVVAVTADVESQGTFAAMGFDDLLLKPVTVDKLGKILAGDRLP